MDVMLKPREQPCARPPLKRRMRRSARQVRRKTAKAAGAVVLPRHGRAVTLACGRARFGCGELMRDRFPQFRETMLAECLEAVKIGRPRRGSCSGDRRRSLRSGDVSHIHPTRDARYRAAVSGGTGL